MRQGYEVLNANGRWLATFPSRDEAAAWIAWKQIAGARIRPTAGVKSRVVSAPGAHIELRAGGVKMPTDGTFDETEGT